MSENPTAKFNLCEYAVVPQVPQIQDVLLLVGINVDDGLMPTRYDAQSYAARMGQYFTTAANGHLYDVHTLMVAAAIASWSHSWDGDKQSWEQHVASMVRRTAQVIVEMTPQGWEDHHAVRRARQILECQAA